MLYRPKPAHVSLRSPLLLLALGLHGLVFGLFTINSHTPSSPTVSIPLVVDLLDPRPLMPPSQPQLATAAVHRQSSPTPISQPKSAPKLETTPSAHAPTPASAATTAPTSTGNQASTPETTHATANPTLTPARFDAAYLRNPAPAYPANARRMGEEGKVLLRVQVTPEGNAETIEVQQSSGSPRLDDAALKAVRQWRFIPAKRGDTPIQSWVTVPLIFALES